MLKKTAMFFLTTYLFFLFMDFTSSDEIFPHFVYVLLKPYVAFWDWMVSWTGSHILRMDHPITIKPNGSGDTTYNYVMQLCWIVLALMIAILWAVLDRRRPGYSRLYYWVRVITRYYFAYVLFTYGFVKIIKLQFPFPGLNTLTETYGNSSPMKLAWTFIGYSNGYNLFTGGAEVLAGVLLFFKRTTLLGSLIALTIMINVFAINMAYDIPVKIFSLNLIFLAIFLAAHDFSRLRAMFFLNTTAPPAQLNTPAPRRRNMILQRSLKGLYVVLALYFTLGIAMKSREEYGELAPKPPLYGIYDVEQFTLQGTPLPPLTTDTARWKRMIISYPGSASLSNMADSLRYLSLKIDTVKKTALFTSYKDSTDTWTMAYSLPDKEHLLFTGSIRKDSVTISMRRFDLNKFQLVNRGFHWINEYPFNR